MDTEFSPDSLQILDPDAQRLTKEMLSAVINHSKIHVNRFIVNQARGGVGFEYFLGHHVANTPTPFKQDQVLSYNMVPQLQFLGFVEDVPKGWYRFTDKALEWFQLYGRRSSRPATAVNTKQYDVFISHASEDKDDVVRPLANTLRHMGLNVWYDEFTLRIGDSLRQSIDRGLRDSRFGVVVLSLDFFAKGWPQYELNGLVAKSIDANGRAVILPIWHNITKAQLMEYSPSLADTVAGNSRTKTTEQIAADIVEVIGRDDDPG